MLNARRKGWITASQTRGIKTGPAVLPGVVLGVCLWVFTACADVPRILLDVDPDHSAATRWHGKVVLAERLLDDMEDLATWHSRGYGRIELIKERRRDGDHALRMFTPVTSREIGDRPGVGAFGEAAAVRHFDNVDWTEYNRISYWVYPIADDFGPVHILTKLLVEGNAVNSRTDFLAMNFTELKNRQWNQVIWEISDLDRAAVTALELVFIMRGKPFAQGPDTLVFDFDRLELQQVEPDHVEGWDVAAGRIAFCHSGYMPGAVKRAFASDLEAGEFSICKSGTGTEVLRTGIQTIKTHVGAYQVMDFTELDKEGVYFIRAGERVSRSFRIGARIWEPSIEKVMNFFYCQRCGVEIPGIHGPCHKEFFCEHEEDRICLNGGWHDAADLTQKGENPEGVYAMLHLAERLRQQGGVADLVEKLRGEAVWGLKWLMKVSFHNGLRFTGGAMRWWMNGKIGDFDDVIREPSTSRRDFYFGLAAAVEAAASRLLQDSDPELASQARIMAEEDWHFAMEFLSEKPGLVPASTGAWASAELYALTRNRQYAEMAVELGNVIARCQLRQGLQGCEKEITGVFRVNEHSDRWARNGHRGIQHHTMMALARLCEVLPDHPDWMNWYAAAAIYSEYFQKTTAEYTAPYYFLPNSIYHLREAGRHIPEAAIRNGISLGGGWYLRAFAIRGGESGNEGVLLSQAKMLSMAARLRRDPALADLAQRQLYWGMGRNPFCQSLMVGEGYDYPPLFAYSGNGLVGALPVGIKVRPPLDVPFWPTQTCWAYKEVWVHPAYLWLWILEDVSGPSRLEGVSGQASGSITICNAESGREIMVENEPSKRLAVEVPPGRYRIQQGEVGAVSTVVMPGESRRVDLRDDRALLIRMNQNTTGHHVRLQATVTGSGPHEFTLRTHNIDLPDLQRRIELKDERPAVLTWSAEITKPEEPWVVLLVPDNDLSRRVEQIGWAKP